MQHSLNEKQIVACTDKLVPQLIVCLVNHYRSGTYYVSEISGYTYLLGAQAYSAEVETFKLPAFSSIDLKVEQPFYLGKDNGMVMNVYLAAQNILNSKTCFMCILSLKRMMTMGSFPILNTRGSLEA